MADDVRRYTVYLKPAAERTLIMRADHNGRVTAGEALRYASYYAHAITRDQRPYGPQTPQVAGDPVRGWTLADPPA